MRNHLWIAVCCAAIGLSALGPVQAGDTPAKLIVHEWGTFLSVQGSDGVSLGGMVESDEILPKFVESRSIGNWERTFWFQKMETPVTYFYVDKPTEVSVRIGMPKGLLTHWYPMVKSFGPPPLPQKAGSAPPQSFIDWKKIRLTPPAMAKADMIPAVDKDQTWRFSRETDAAVISVPIVDSQRRRTQQQEKFLFYRGLGSFPLPLEIGSEEGSAGQVRLRLKNNSTDNLSGMFAIAVENGQIRHGRLTNLAGGAMRMEEAAVCLGTPKSLAEGVPMVMAALRSVLVEAGLYEKEAAAMVNTWERSYFQSDGLRVLYILPQSKVDEVIPISITPKPTELKRIMVARVEVLTPQTEKQIEGFVRQLGASEFKKREEATKGLGKLGRIGEPALRRLLATTQDAEVRARAKQLLSQMTQLN